MELNNKKAIVIGCGSIGSRYIKLLSDLNFKVGCYDIKKINKKNFAKKFIFFKSIKDSIKSKPDIIIIPTPPKSHLKCLREAIKSDAKILLEKPLAASIKDSKSIIEIDKKNKNRIWCVSNMRYHPAFEKLKKNFKRLGKIYYVSSHFSHRLSQMRSSGTNVFAAKKNEGGVILDCVHDIDLVIKLFGKLTLTNSRIASIGREKIEAEDLANIWLLGKNGIHVTMNFDFLSRWKTRGIKIIGEKGTMIWNSQGRKPEIVSVKLFGSNGIIDTLIDNSKLSHNYVYKEMLIDFIGNCKNLQNIKESFKVFKIAMDARLN